MWCTPLSRVIARSGATKQSPSGVRGALCHGRPPGARPRQCRPRRVPTAGGDAPRANGRGNGRPPVRVAGVQVGEIQRHCARPRRRHGRDRERTAQSRWCGGDCRKGCWRPRPWSRAGLRRVLPVSRRHRRRGPRRRDGGHSARRLGARRGSDRNCHGGRDRHGLQGRPPLPSLTQLQAIAKPALFEDPHGEPPVRKIGNSAHAGGRANCYGLLNLRRQCCIQNGILHKGGKHAAVHARTKVPPACPKPTLTRPPGWPKFLATRSQKSGKSIRMRIPNPSDREVRNMRTLTYLAAALMLIVAASLLPAAAAQTVPAKVVAEIARARLATTKYAMDLESAKADGYAIITPMIPNMGYHFLNSKIQGFDITKPPILVYVRKSDAWQLAAIEWVYPKRPASPPLPGAQYGSFGAACHYVDGSFVEAAAEDKCGKANAKTGAAFNFWHPPLVTLHLWIWYPNPSGIFGEFNPLLTPFNND